MEASTYLLKTKRVSSCQYCCANYSTMRIAPLRKAWQKHWHALDRPFNDLSLLPLLKDPAIEFQTAVFRLLWKYADYHPQLIEHFHTVASTTHDEHKQLMLTEIALYCNSPTLAKCLLEQAWPSEPQCRIMLSLLAIQHGLPYAEKGLSEFVSYASRKEYLTFFHSTVVKTSCTSATIILIKSLSRLCYLIATHGKRKSQTSLIRNLQLILQSPMSWAQF